MVVLLISGEVMADIGVLALATGPAFPTHLVSWRVTIQLLLQDVFTTKAQSHKDTKKFFIFPFVPWCPSCP